MPEQRQRAGGQGRAIVPICPTCDNPARTTSTQYGARHECCGLHSWDGKPLVDQATHDARQAAHDAFDTLWKKPTKLMSRGEAYAELRIELGIRARDCHMSLMSAETAALVPAAVERIRARITGLTPPGGAV